MKSNRDVDGETEDGKAKLTVSWWLFEFCCTITIVKKDYLKV